MTDPLLKETYSVTKLSGKKANKTELQKELGLAVSDAPLFGTISRLAEQKGIDIQLAALEEMLSTDMQFVLLGSGSPAYEHGYHELARRFQIKVVACFGYNEEFGAPHRSRLRLLPDAIAVRTQRLEPNVQSALRDDSHCPGHRRPR